MLKPPTYNIADSNIANLGSDLEKSVREAAAKCEPAWQNAGKKVGLKVWRIEKFQVVSWPDERYGEFYSGDSYICLHTYKKPEGDAFQWDVYFWLGAHTTQDEAGTAAYKTVELDDLLGGAPIQHREVQGHESKGFETLFPKMKILDGGVESGFNHVEPEKFTPRLLHLKGKKKIRATQVSMATSSMNSGDVFILDLGLNLYQWNGSKAGPMEKMAAGKMARAIDDERKGLAEVHVFEEGDGDIPAVFWETLGGKDGIKSAEEGGSDTAPGGEKRLFQLSDASGKMEFKKVGEGSIKKSLLDSNDVFVFDIGSEVFVWVGKGASKAEKAKGLGYAQDYLANEGRPAWLPISRILEGGENEVFESSFD